MKWAFSAGAMIVNKFTITGSPAVRDFDLILYEMQRRRIRSCVWLSFFIQSRAKESSWGLHRCSCA
jgi:hypothetical protein